ncbi:MAG: hypothetical protein ACHP9W_04345 [Steroidobacterales bacterium]
MASRPGWAHGITREMIQSAVRIAAVVHALAGVLEYSSGQAGTRPISNHTALPTH